MSSSDADKNGEVVSYFEAFLVFIVFSFVLFVLYPKDMLQRQILAESSNYDLTAIYLENMLRLEPENRELTVALLKASIRSGKYDLALKVIEALEKGADEALLKELMGYRIEALKVKYFSTNEKKFQDEARSEISVLLKEAAEKGRYEEKELEHWYALSREFSLNTQALFFLNALIAGEERAQWLEECFYLSSEMRDEKMQNECLMKLRRIDQSRYEKWTEQAFYLAVKEGKTEQAISLIKDMASRSLRWHKELAKFYVELKRYKESSKEYMRLYKGAKSTQEKKAYFLKALEALQYGSLMEEAAALAREYEAFYYRDREMSLKLIKLYLGAGKLDDAKRLSIQRLKYME